MNDTRLTIVMPLFNRPLYFQRIVRFFIAHPPPFPVIFADGSHSRQCQKIFNDSRLTKPWFQFYSHSPDRTYQQFNLKMRDTFQKVQSPYVVWWCDDDFYDYRFLQKAVNTLEANPKLVACAGEVVDFQMSNCLDGNETWGSIEILSHHRRCSGRYDSQKSIELPTFADRLALFSTYSPLEAVHQTRIVSKVFDILSEVKTVNYWFTRFAWAYLSLQAGGFRYFPSDIMLLRQEHGDFHEGASYMTVANLPTGPRMVRDLINKIAEIPQPTNKLQQTHDYLSVSQLLDLYCNHLETVLQSTRIDGEKYFSRNREAASYIVKSLLDYAKMRFRLRSKSAFGGRQTRRGTEDAHRKLSFRAPESLDIDLPGSRTLLQNAQSACDPYA